MKKKVKERMKEVAVVVVVVGKRKEFKILWPQGQ